MEKNKRLLLFKLAVVIAISLCGVTSSQSEEGGDSGSYNKELETLSKEIESLKSGRTKDVSTEDEGLNDLESAPSKSKHPDFTKSKEEVIQLSGQPKLMRNLGKVEVFFKDLKDSYFIPSGRKQYEIHKAFQNGIKTSTPVSFTAGKKSRQIFEVLSSSSTSSGRDGHK